MDYPVHTCDIKWLIARKNFLTASDVIKLVPFSKTGRKRTITDEMYAELIISKMRTITNEETISTGAAARGHWLEPFAINQYNETFSKQFYHWDDVVLCNESYPGIAFSPDAMSISQQENPIRAHSCKLDVMTLPGPHEILEIKSYKTERHIKTLMTPQDELEERWQVATAMAVDPNIDKASLVLFNPSFQEFQLKVFDWTRADLIEEREVIEKIRVRWIHIKKEILFRLPTMTRPAKFLSEDGCQQEVWNKEREKNRLNPRI